MSKYKRIDFKRFNQLYKMMEFIGAEYGYIGFSGNKYNINIGNFECELSWDLVKKEYYYKEELREE